MGKKAKKRGQIGKISASEASLAVAWGGGKGPYFLSAFSRLASLTDLFFRPRLFFTPFSPSAEPGPRIISM